MINKIIIEAAKKAGFKKYSVKNGVYLAANGKLYVFDENLSSKEEVLDINLTDFSEDNDNYYWLIENKMILY